MPFVPPIRFTVSQLRVAAACPRMHHFDCVDNRENDRVTPRVSRLWEPGDGSMAAGSLFHDAVEKFNREAGRDGAVREIVERDGADRDALFRGLMRHFTHRILNRPRLVDLPADVIHNFSRCVEAWFGELADIIHKACTEGRPAGEIVGELFADLPKRVDLTLHVGPREQPVHVVGRLDYVFFDRRSDRLRILDYKLGPASSVDKDRFQVAAYATLYRRQHGYASDAGVLYLHPERVLVDLPWSEVQELRHGVYDLLASMVEWARFDPAAGTGLRPPGNVAWCAACRWRRVCENRLGEKSLGESLHGRSESREPTEPRVEVTAVPLSAPAEPDEELTDEPPDVDPGPTGEGDMLWLGATPDAQHDVRIEKRHLSTHTIIVGAAGSGKTWLAKAFLEEAILCGVPVLAIDPQGDLVQFLRPSDESGLSEAERAGRRRFLERVEPRIFTPGTAHGVRLALSPIRMPTVDELARLRETGRESAIEDLIGEMALDLAALATQKTRKVEQEQTILVCVLRALMKPARERSGTCDPSRRTLRIEDIADALHDPESVGVDQPDRFISRTAREKLGRQLYALVSGPFARQFTGGMTLDLGRLQTPVAAGRTPLNVVYLNAMNEAEKPVFVASLASEIYRWMICSGGDARSPRLLFSIDEASTFLPSGTYDPPAKRPLLRLFAQGRKYGVGCLLCTQSPRSVDYNVVSNCSTKIIGRLESAQDSETIAKWFQSSGPRPGWIGERPGAAAGTFVARWPEQPADLDGAVFTSRRLYSQHGGAWSPEQVESALADDATHAALRRSGA